MSIVYSDKHTLKIYRGDSKTITVTLSKNGGIFANGHIWFTIKSKKDNIKCSDPEHLCVFQTNAPIVEVTDPDDPSIIIGYRAILYIPPSASKDFSITSFVYDIQAVGANDEPGNPGSPANVRTLVEGKFKVLEDVTIRW